MKTKNYTLHIKPVEDDPDYIKAVDILRDTGFCLTGTVRKLIKDFAKKVETSGF